MRRSTITWGWTAVLVITLSGSVFASGVDLTGIGARAQTLGGCYRAVANDWSAMYWNPAGLVHSNGLNAGFSLEFIKVGVGYTSARSLAGQQFSGTSANEVENEPKTFLVPSGGVYYTKGNLSFGIGVWAPFGLGAEWDLLNTSAYNSNYPEIDYEDDLKLIDIHPTVSYKVSDQFSVGVGLSIIMADIMIRKPNFTPNPYIYDQNLAPLVQAALAPTGGLQPPYDHLLTEQNLEGDGTGFGANFGIMYKPTETLTIGASLQYYSTIELEGTVDATTYFANNPTAQATVMQGLKPTFDAMLAGEKITLEQYQVLLGYYSGTTNTRASAKKITADLPLPLKAGIGISYTGISNLLIAADVALTQWSAWDIIEIKDENGAKYSQLVENWEDGIRVGVGLEYSLPMMKLRGAFYTEPNAAIPETMTPTIPDINQRNVGMIGVEVPIGPIRLHASYEKMFIGDLTVDTWVLDEEHIGYENMAGKYTMDVNNFMVGIDYIF